MNERPIKFRAWNITTNRMTGWGQFFVGRQGVAWDNTRNDLILMQFTGLTDKNGKEIWEGDILEHNDTRIKVEQIVPVDRFYGSYDTPYEDDWMSASDIDWEVIGNIYENPELLKEKI